MTTRGVSVHWAIFDLVPEAPEKRRQNLQTKKGDGKGHKGKEENKNKSSTVTPQSIGFQPSLYTMVGEKKIFPFLEKKLGILMIIKQEDHEIGKKGLMRNKLSIIEG